MKTAPTNSVPDNGQEISTGLSSLDRNYPESDRPEMGRTVCS